MGLLAGATLTAIEARAGVRMVWSVNVPQGVNRASFNAVVVHDDDKISNDASCVIDPGTREYEGVGASFMSPGKFKT
jgi:hypothetical protein